MTESPDDAAREDHQEEGVPAEKQDERSSDTAGDRDIGPGGTPGEGGYEDRDPETDMPRMPSHPETQEDK